MMRDRFLKWVSFCFFIGCLITWPTATSGQGYSKNILQGSFVARQDLSFTFASTDRTIPGIGFHLQSTGQEDVKGFVVDELNSPIAAAEIWFCGYYGRVPLRERTTSKDDGTFEIKLPVDVGLGKVQWSSYAVHENSVCTNLAYVDDQLKFTLGRGRKLIVRAVEEKDGRPTDDFIRDYFLHLQDGRILPSDPGGICDVSGLVPEVQYVIATAPGRSPFVAMLDLNEDRQVELKVTLRKGGRVHGQVRDDEDKLVPFNPVYSWTCERSLFTVGHGLSDAEGHYELTGIAVGRPARVSAFSHRDGNAMYSEEEWITIRSSDEPKSIDFQVSPKKVADTIAAAALPAGLRDAPNGRSRGIVRLPDGKPCPVFKLRIQGSTKQRSMGGWAASYESIGVTFSNPDGTFLFSGIPAKSAFRATVSADGYCDAVVDPIVSMESESKDELDLHEFKLKPAVKPQISVSDINGNRIKGAIVELYRSQLGNRIQPYQRGRYVASGTTDANGKAEMTTAPIESGRVIVIAEGFGEQQFDWTDGSAQDFQLKPTASLKIQVRIIEPTNTNIEFYLVDERRQASYPSGKLRFNEGIASWEIPGILPGLYKISGSGSGNEAYDLVMDDDDKAIPRVIELSEPRAYELKLLMERK